MRRRYEFIVFTEDGKDVTEERMWVMDKDGKLYYVNEIGKLEHVEGYHAWVTTYAE